MKNSGGYLVLNSWLQTSDRNYLSGRVLWLNSLIGGASNLLWLSVEQLVKISETGWELYVRFFPDLYVDDSGAYGTLSRELKNPAIGIRLFTNERPFKEKWQGVLKPKDSTIIDGYTLEFFDIQPIVYIHVIKDPSYYGILVGWLVVVIGLVLRYLVPGKNNKRTFGNV